MIRVFINRAMIEVEGFNWWTRLFDTAPVSQKVEKTRQRNQAK